MMGVRATIPTMILLLLPLTAWSQGRLESEEDPDYGLLIGISVWEELSFQLGGAYVFNQECTESFCFQEGTSVGVEYLPGDDAVLGIRGSVWTARLLAAGIGVGYYIGPDSSIALLQPEVGIGFSGARLMFRINLPLDGSRFDRASEIEITASGMIDIF